jgi:2-polyprenyl-3-methyl-5-hydroxy-6-metoxy-1,4-benzoquinol methylase
MNLSKIFKSKISKNVSYILDNFLPPVIRDNRFFYGTIIKIWNSKMDIDFKRKALLMTDQEFNDAYEKLVPMRDTDNTNDTINFVLKNIVGNSILEVGCGNGDMSISIAKLNKKVMASDIAEGNIRIVKEKVASEGLSSYINTSVENIEYLSFEDKSFDTIICLHTLEHVRFLNKAIDELKRVAKKRIIIIVPKQKFSRYTADYHLNFFGEPAQLQLCVGLKNSFCVEIDNCLSYYGDLN